MRAPEPRPQPAQARSAEQARSTEQARAGGAPATPRRPPGPAPAPDLQGNFASVLERIAKQVGLAPPGQAGEVLPDGDPEGWPEPAPVRHAGAITAQLDGPVDLGVPQTAPRLALLPDQQLSNLGSALLGLGFPLAACQTVARVTNRQSLEAELLRALEKTLPPLPPMPRAASSVIAVVGPRVQAIATARALAAEVGARADEVALATQRNIWRQQDRVIASPEAAREERRSWRWRGHPSVVAVEMAVRPAGAEWAAPSPRRSNQRSAGA